MTATPTVMLKGMKTKVHFNEEELNELKVDFARANLVHEKREWISRAIWDFDVEVTNLENQLELIDVDQEFDHTIYNNNQFPIAVRIMASGSGRLKTKKAYFFIDMEESQTFTVSIKPLFPDHSERVVLHMIPINEEDQRMCTWRLRPDSAFQNIFPTVDFTIRYRKVPLWSTLLDAAMSTKFELNKNTMNLVETMYDQDKERKELMAKADQSEIDASYDSMHYLLSLDLAINHQDDQAQLKADEKDIKEAAEKAKKEAAAKPKA